MDAFNHFEELSSCRHLFLETVTEPTGNALKVEVVEGRLSQVAVPIEVAGHSLGEGHPVHSDDSCTRFELTWNSYVLYQVTNESYGKKEQSENGLSGNSASIYQSSSLLEYVVRSTIASNEYPGRLAHFRIVCSDHVIDVISTERPECLRIDAKLKVH